MIYQQVKASQNYRFEIFWNNYTSSFREEVRRNIEKQEVLLNNSLYNLYTVWEGDKYIGFIAYWKFEDSIYIEHFAISAGLRGGGYGSRMVQDILDQYRGYRVMVEVKPVEDRLSEARVRFYKKMGFVFNEYEHNQPYYMDVESNEWLKLHIMSYEKGLSKQEFERFSAIMEEVVYKGNAESYTR